MGYFIGLDLGQSKDYTALTVLELVPAPLVEVVTGWTVTREPSKEPPALHVRHLERFPLGTRYPTIVEAVRNRMHALTNVFIGRPTLIVDKTGVGAPVVDLFSEAGLEPVAITITAGGEPTVVPGGWNVPKRDLVSVVQTTLQTQRLRFAEGLPDVQLLTHELLNFEYKLTAKAHDTYNAREGKHDDMVLSLALAVWYAEVAYFPLWTKEDLAVFSRAVNV